MAVCPTSSHAVSRRLDPEPRAPGGSRGRSGVSSPDHGQHRTFPVMVNVARLALLLGAGLLAAGPAPAAQADEAAVHYNMALQLKRQGKIPEAIGEAEKAVKLRSDYGAAYFTLGNLWRAAGRLPQGGGGAGEGGRAAAPGRGRPLEPGRDLPAPEAHRRRASSSWRRPCDLKPDDYETLVSLGFAYRQKGDLIKAVAYLQQGDRAAPQGGDRLEQPGGGAGPHRREGAGHRGLQEGAGDRADQRRLPLQPGRHLPAPAADRGGDRRLPGGAEPQPPPGGRLLRPRHPVLPEQAARAGPGGVPQLPEVRGQRRRRLPQGRRGAAQVAGERARATEAEQQTDTSASPK